MNFRIVKDFLFLSDSQLRNMKSVRKSAGEPPTIATRRTPKADRGYRPHHYAKDKNALEIGIALFGGVALIDFVVKGIEVEYDDAENDAAGEEKDVAQAVSGEGEADEDGGDDEAGVSDEEAVAIGVAEGGDEDEHVDDNERGEKLVIKDVVEVFDGGDETEFELIEFGNPIGEAVNGKTYKDGYEDCAKRFFEEDKALDIRGDGAVFAIDEEIAEYENEEKQDEKATDVVKEINVFPGHDVHFVPTEPGDVFEDAANENEGNDLVLLCDGNGKGTRQIINQEIDLENKYE
jgi:hypothetical protein